MDMSMPDAGGIDATRRIKQLVPEAKVLVLTVHEDKGLMQEAIRSGAMGYILKRAIKSELINAIHSVMRDELYLHPAMARLLFMEEKNSPVQAAKSSSVTLTFRGYTNNQAAEKLKISVRTVEYHRGNLTDKLNLRSRVELMRYAEEKGLI